MATSLVFGARDHVKKLTEVLKAAVPGGLQRQALIHDVAPFVREQVAAQYGSYLVPTEVNQQAIYQRQVAIVADAIRNLIKSGKVVHGQASDTLFWQDKSRMLPRYVAMTDIADDVPGYERHEDEVTDLADSMRAQGQLNAILLVTTDDVVYHLAAGHRRVKAAWLLEWPTIEARVQLVDEDDLVEIVHELRVHENQYTRPLTPLEHEEAEGFLMARAKEISNEVHIGRPKKVVTGVTTSEQQPAAEALTKTTKQDNSKRTAQQLAKEQGITVRQAQRVLKLAQIEARLQARAGGKRWAGDPKGYTPTPGVSLIAQNLLGKLQMAQPDDLPAVRAEALETIREYETHDIQQWKVETDNGTKPTAKQAAKAARNKKLYDAEAVYMAVLSMGGFTDNEIARGRHSVEHTTVKIKDGKTWLDAWFEARLKERAT